jgi:hypothetical protein
MAYRVLNIQPETKGVAIFTEIDGHLTIIGNGDPNGVQGADNTGIRYWDEAGKASWVATVADGTAGGTTWERFPIHADEAAFVNPGIASPDRYVAEDQMSTIISGLTGFKSNYIRNALMATWTRSGTNVIVHDATTFLSSDGWQAYMSERGGELGVSTAKVPITGSIPDAMRLSRNAQVVDLTDTLYLEHVFEFRDVTEFAGNVMTISFDAFYDAGFSASTIRVRMYTGTQTIERSRRQNNYLGEQIPLDEVVPVTGTQARYSYTFTVPSGVTQATLIFEVDPEVSIQANENLYVTGIKLENGISATAIDANREWLAWDLIRSRYVYTSFPIDVAAAVGKGTDGCFVCDSWPNETMMMIQLPLPMRTKVYTVMFYSTEVGEAVGTGFYYGANALYHVPMFASNKGNQSFLADRDALPDTSSWTNQFSVRFHFVVSDEIQ